MLKTIFLKNIHFICFDNWFVKLPELEQNDLISKYEGLEKYLGIELASTSYDEEKGFEFKILDLDRWEQKKIEHDFLQNIIS